MIAASTYRSAVQVRQRIGCAKMTFHLNMTLGSEELTVIEEVLGEWCAEHGINHSSPDTSIAGAVLVALFKEGNFTAPALRRAASQHKWLAHYNPEAGETAVVSDVFAKTGAGR
ncbi:hypothetical protein QTL95_06615 [Rhizobium sp. S152]|uniref:hypothetical protein n=1 Tax=Rhizobium sp. S152 TaxID=3055038 RepID=UPI0025A9C4D9|nr:hypothetical protein [Rhizobium sp. S152]MDM9625560.1 hypothetical protein [Rhizobium sp. S152]